jgi:hypothetical protein
MKDARSGTPPFHVSQFPDDQQQAESHPPAGTDHKPNASPHPPLRKPRRRHHPTERKNSTMPRGDPQLAAPLVPGESTDGFNHRESAVTPSSSAAGVRQSRGCRLAAVGAIGLGLIAMVGVGLSGHKSTSADSPSAPPSPPEHRAVNETALVLSYKEWKDLNRADFSMHSAQEHEEDKRAEIFAHNKALIDAHNEKYAAGEASYLMATGPFADAGTEIRHEPSGVAVTQRSSSSSASSPRKACGPSSSATTVRGRPQLHSSSQQPTAQL